MCVYSETRKSFCQQALDPWVQPSIDFFCNTHVCVCTAAIGAKVVEFSVPSLGFLHWKTLQHTRVCVFNLSGPLLQHMCVGAHSSNRSAKVLKVKASTGLFCSRHVYIQATHTCACPQQRLVCVHNSRHFGRPTFPQLNTCVYVVTAAIGLPKL